MKLKLVRHLWGVDMPISEAFPKIKTDGYEAIECPLRDDAQFKSLLAEHGFDYIPMAFTAGASVAEHVQSFRTQFDQAVKLGAKKLVVHSGSDAFSLAEAKAFYTEIVAIEKTAAMEVAHETHRGRAFFNPWITRDLLHEFASLQLCIDFSHWVCVAERLNWDDASGSIVKLCAQRAIHVHCRVGYEEGPQVPDPSAPEYAGQVEQHLKWWDEIFTAQKTRGVQVATATPEFGPPGYLHTLPHTNVPVADLWKVCNWMAAKVKARFIA